jgi:hypothetical protein
MLVSEFVKAVDQGRESIAVKSLSDVKLTDEGIVFTDSSIQEPIVFDEVAEKRLSSYLGINSAYLKKCPAELKQQNVNYWLQRFSTSEALFHSIDGHLQNIHRPDKVILPAKKFAESISTTFQPSDTIRNLKFDGESLHVDITSDRFSVEVLGTGTEERPRVGDITHGGLRAFAYPTRERAPRIETYLHRLVCSNGLSVAEPDLTIRLKGNTVTEVLGEIEQHAQELMRNLPTRLQAYHDSASIPLEGDIGKLIFELARERGISGKVLDRIMVRSAELPDNPTAYDLTQLFTSIANEGVSYRSQMRLQRLGGLIGLQTEETLHRCTNCERPL